MLRNQFEEAFVHASAGYKGTQAHAEILGLSLVPLGYEAIEAVYAGKRLDAQIGPITYMPGLNSTHVRFCELLLTDRRLRKTVFRMHRLMIARLIREKGMAGLQDAIVGMAPLDKLRRLA